jgi:hypothetical protein
LRFFASAKEHGAVSRNPGEKFTVSKSLITNPFGDKTPEIILVPGKPGFGASPRRPKCLLMQQHGLFPKSAFRRHRANIEDPLGKSGRESLDQIGPYFRRRTRLRIGTRSQLDLHHWTDVGRFTAGCGIMEEQRRFHRQPSPKVLPSEGYSGTARSTEF